MKTIQTLLHTAIIVASLAPETIAASRLRGGKPSNRPPLKNWAVSYDTTRACLPGKAGRVVATIKPTSATAQSKNNSRGAVVVFRVAGQGRAAPYVQATRIQSNGRATVPIGVMGAFVSQGRTSTDLACTVQVGNGAVQKVACPTLPVCTVDEGPGFVAPTPSPTPDESGLLAPTSSPTILESDEFLAPTESPTPDESGLLAPTSSPTPDESVLLAPTASPTPDESGLLAPTESPTPDESGLLAPTSSPTILEGDGFLAPTASPTADESDLLAPTSAPSAEGTEDAFYSITTESGPLSYPPSCLDASLTVTVLHNGVPVEGRDVSLLVVAPNGDYEVSAITNQDGMATLTVSLDPADQDQDLWTSLAVENPLLAQYQQFVPALNFGC